MTRAQSSGRLRSFLSTGRVSDGVLFEHYDAIPLGKTMTKPVGDNHRYQSILSSLPADTAGVGGLMAAASSHAQRTTDVSSEREKTLCSISAGVIAPLLFGYVSWILRRTNELNLDCVYFMSRDGQVMLDVANTLANRYSVIANLRYLYASRQVFSRATFDGVNHGSWLWTNLSGETTLTQFFGRLGIDPATLESSLRRAGIELCEASKPLGVDGIKKMRVLLADNEVITKVRSQVEAQKALAVRYLEQELATASPFIGCVDIGWQGSVHSAICGLLESRYGISPHGFHFGLVPGNSTGGSSREAYFFDLRNGSGYVDVSPEKWAAGDRMKMLIETFCAADHGTVTDFKTVNEIIEPSLRDGWKEQINGWGLPVIRSTILSFIEYVEERISAEQMQADVRPAIARVLREFWMRPTLAEAKVWGAFPLEAGQGDEAHLEQLASPYSWNYLARQVTQSDRMQSMVHHWRFGSLRLTSQPLRLIMRLIFHAHDLRKSLFS